MKLISRCMGAVAPLAVAAVLALGALAPAAAQQFRLPSLSYASDAELGSITRTGFIISPDWSFSDEVSLGGTGGQFLEDPDGWAIGAKVGYDQQVGDIVIGGIVDGLYSFADGNGRGVFAPVFETDLKYYGTVRGKLGYSFGRFMVYGTAGYAYGRLEVSNPILSLSDTKSLNGWAYGGGIEYAWNRDINLHAGYRRLDFDTVSVSSMPAPVNTLAPELDVFDLGIVTRY